MATRAFVPLLLTGVLLVAGCSGDPVEGSGAPEAPVESTTEPSEESSAAEAPSETASPTRVPLPSPLSLKDVDGETIRAVPFADFAVAAGDGAWVTGVEPGAVRYDRSGKVSARVRVEGDVQQAIEQSGGSVWLPTSERTLLRVDAATGRIIARAKLPGTPLVESAVGAVGDTAYVLVQVLQRKILVVRDGRVVQRIAAPPDARAVRAGHGALWVPTTSDTVERYDLAKKEWTTIAVGPSPRFLDVGFGAVWVMGQADGSVTRIDARTLEPEVLPGSGAPIMGGDLTTGAGAVWLRTDAAVLRLDPRRGRVTHLLELPAGSGSVAATADALWITNHDHLAVHRVPLPLPR
jgi:hypothetical protein